MGRRERVKGRRRKGWGGGRRKKVNPWQSAAQQQSVSLNIHTHQHKFSFRHDFITIQTHKLTSKSASFLLCGFPDVRL